MKTKINIVHGQTRPPQGSKLQIALSPNTNVLATSATWLLVYNQHVLRLRQVTSAQATVSAPASVMQSGLVPVTWSSAQATNPEFEALFEVIGQAGQKATITASIPSFVDSSGNTTTVDPGTLTIIIQPTPLSLPNGCSLSYQIPDGSTSSDYTFMFQASGGVPPYHWSSNTTPPGLLLHDSGLLNGRPTTAGKPDFNVKLTDSDDPPQSYSVGVDFTVTNGSLDLVSDVQTFPFALGQYIYGGATPYGGQPPYNVSARGLPPGISINAARGYLEGYPTTLGIYDTEFSVKDAAGATAVASATIRVEFAKETTQLGQLPGTGVRVLAVPNIVAHKYSLTVEIDIQSVQPPWSQPAAMVLVSFDGQPVAHTASAPAAGSIITLHGTVHAWGLHSIEVSLVESSTLTTETVRVRSVQLQSLDEPGSPIVPTLAAGTPNIFRGASATYTLQVSDVDEQLLVVTSSAVELISLHNDGTIKASSGLSLPPLDLVEVLQSGANDPVFLVAASGTTVLTIRQDGGIWTTGRTTVASRPSALAGLLDGKGNCVALVASGPSVSIIDCTTGTIGPTIGSGLTPSDRISAFRLRTHDDGTLAVQVSGYYGDAVAVLTAIGPHGAALATGSIDLYTARQPVALLDASDISSDLIAVTRAAGKITYHHGGSNVDLTVGGHPTKAALATIGTDGHYTSATVLATVDTGSGTLGESSINLHQHTVSTVRSASPGIVDVTFLRLSMGRLALASVSSSGEIRLRVNPVYRPWIQVNGRPLVSAVSQFGAITFDCAAGLLIKNTGGAMLTINAIDLRISSATPASAQTGLQGFPIQLQPNQIITVPIQIHASQSQVVGTVVIRSNDPVHSRIEVPIRLH